MTIVHVLHAMLCVLYVVVCCCRGVAGRAERAHHLCQPINQSVCSAAPAALTQGVYFGPPEPPLLTLPGRGGLVPLAAPWHGGHSATAHLPGAHLPRHPRSSITERPVCCPPPLRRGQSQYRGVTRHHQHGKWESRIGKVDGSRYLYLGTYDTAGKAAKACWYTLLPGMVAGRGCALSLLVTVRG